MTFRYQVSLLFFSAFLTSRIKKLRIKVQKYSDERLQKLQETLSIIKIIKMYTWEQFFYERISKSRQLVSLKMKFKKSIAHFLSGRKLKTWLGYFSSITSIPPWVYFVPKHLSW